MEKFYPFGSIKKTKYYISKRTKGKIDLIGGYEIPLGHQFMICTFFYFLIFPIYFITYDIQQNKMSKICMTKNLHDQKFA